ncbi:GNAT family N-acetyltransferase [Solibacillus sp. CAU 1738]|uniref:GNAT family N-acetyltransferase n=1 Tax=Solibacillus sp. CAU 1738 TaxID=3140363 RepID=UPI003260ADEF
MNYVPFQEQYIDDAIMLWNKQWQHEFPLRKELFIQNSVDDVNIYPQGCFAAIDKEGILKGFVIAKKWQEQVDVKMDTRRGWIQVIIVDEAIQRQGIGTKLLELAEDALQQVGIEEIQLGGDPFHYFAGIPSTSTAAQAMAEKFGYVKRIDTHDLVNHLSKEYAMPAGEHLEYTLLQPDEQQDLYEFFARCFPGRWEYEAMKYFELGGQGREFVVLKKHGRIIGFCRINDDDSPMIAQNVYWRTLFPHAVGGIGPLGIDEKEQKQGYGLAIVQAGMAFLQQRKMETIIIDWTNLVEFYEKLDFNVWKTYGIYLKDVTKEK